MSNVKRGIPAMRPSRVRTRLPDQRCSYTFHYVDGRTKSRDVTRKRSLVQKPAAGLTSPRRPTIRLADGTWIPWNGPSEYSSNVWERDFINHDHTPIYRNGQLHATLTGYWHGNWTRRRDDFPNIDWGNEIYCQVNGLRFRNGNGIGGAPLLTYRERNSFYESFINGFSDGAELLVSAAEIDKSLSMLAGLSITFTKVVRGLKTGNIEQIVKALELSNKPKLKSKNFSGRWLEFQYGIKPLLGDIQSTIEVLSRQVSVYRLHRIRRSRAHSVFAFAPALDAWEGSNAFVVHEENLAVQRTHFYEWLNDTVYLLNKLGLFNVLGTVWDVIPYSLVVDWFLPVNTMLKRASAFAGTRIPQNTGYESTSLSLSYTRYSRESVRDSFVPVYTGRCFATYRRKVDSWPILMPYIKNPFSSTRIVSAISMLNNLR